MKKLKYFIFSFIILIELNLTFINPAIMFGNYQTILYADELSGLKLSGYGTISASVHDRNNIHPARDVSQNPNNRFETNFSAVMDSRIGLQAHYRFNTDLDFVAQGVLRDQAYITFDNSIDAVYTAYRPNSWLELRAGRFGYDAFLMSDTRNLGYAYTWVRPPTEFYGWIPIFHIDGADTTFRINSGGSQWRFRFQIGDQGFKFPIAGSDYDSQTDGLHTVTLSRQSGPFTIKAGYSKFSFKKEMDLFADLQNGLNSIAESTASLLPEISEEAHSLSNNLVFKHTEVQYMTLGASYDDGEWIAQAEIAQTTATAEVFSQGAMGYAALGYRIEDFTPYVIFGAVRPGNNLRESASDWSLIDAADLQGTAIGIINSTRMNQQTFSFGVRWDFHVQAAIKFQLDSVHFSTLGHGLVFAKGDLLTKEGTMFEESTMTLGTLSLEFVF